MTYNLSSRYAIDTPIELESLEDWFREECSRLPPGAEQRVAVEVSKNLGSFVKMPARALLLWRGCDRVPTPPAKQRYHSYPEALKILAKHAKVYLDGRPNGPAMAAYLYAGVGSGRIDMADPTRGPSIIFIRGSFPTWGASTRRMRQNRPFTSPRARDSSRFTRLPTHLWMNSLRSQPGWPGPAPIKALGMTRTGFSGTRMSSASRSVGGWRLSTRRRPKGAEIWRICGGPSLPWRVSRPNIQAISPWLSQVCTRCHWH